MDRYPFGGFEWRRLTENHDIQGEVVAAPVPRAFAFRDRLWDLPES